MQKTANVGAATPNLLDESYADYANTCKRQKVNELKDSIRFFQGYPGYLLAQPEGFLASRGGTCCHLRLASRTRPSSVNATKVPLGTGSNSAIGLPFRLGDETLSTGVSPECAIYF